MPNELLMQLLALYQLRTNPGTLGNIVDVSILER